MSQRFTPEGAPLPRERARVRPHEAIPWAVLALIACLGALAFRAETGRVPAPALASPPPSSGSSSPWSNAAAADLGIIAAALSTLAAPSPTPTPKPAPTATYARLPTAAPVYCGMGNPDGHECRWPAFTPTPAPAPPVCVTPVERETCLWLGPPTPTPESGFRFDVWIATPGAANPFD